MAIGYLSPDPRLRELSDLGVVLPGAKLFTYVSGTPSTPLATYSDSALTVPNSNPIVASAGGLFGPIYLTPGLAYKYVLTDALGGPIWSQDPVSLAGAGAGTPITSGTGVQDFRLTLTTGVPVTPTDVLAATILYLTPRTGNGIALFDAAGTASLLVSPQVSIALPAVASQLYDVFAWNNAGVVTLELLAWTNDTTRATALTLATTGVYTKTGDLTRRYLGSVRTTTVAGQTEDSAVKRYVWNYTNRVPRLLTRVETASSWSYTTAAYRQANANAANQVDVVIGVAEVVLDLTLYVTVESTVNAGVAIGIGEDNVAVPFSPMDGGFSFSGNAAIPYGFRAHIVRPPAVGRHYYAWLENGQGVASVLWGGTWTATQYGAAGLYGSIQG